MKKYLKSKLNNEKGMTLIELLAVIVIIAIIAAIAIPAIGNIIENSRYSAVKADASSAMSAANIYYTENPEDTDGVLISELASEGYLESIGSLDDAGDIINNTADGLRISAGPIDYSGNRTLEFVAASLENINNDNQTGSANPIVKVIGTGATTDTN